MNKQTKVIILLAVIIFMISFILPSRLTSHDSQTIMTFANSNLIGYQVYFLVLFPISTILFLFKKCELALLSSTAFLFINNDLFENAVELIFNDIPFWTIGLMKTILPLILFISIGIWMIRKSFKKESLNWFGGFILLVLGFYLIVNDRNCMIKFVSDVGYKKYELSIWFRNCGTYYAWWIAGILLNIGISTELIKRKKMLTVVENHNYPPE